MHGFEVYISAFLSLDNSRIKSFRLTFDIPEKYTCFIHEWIPYFLHGVRYKDFKRFRFTCNLDKVNKEKHIWSAIQEFDVEKEYCGLEQVMDAARHFIQSVISKENRIGCQKAKQRLVVFEEELITKSCHPRRMTRWILNDFDPFAE